MSVCVCERIDDANAVNVAAIMQVLGQDLLAVGSHRRFDDQRVPD